MMRSSAQEQSCWTVGEQPYAFEPELDALTERDLDNAF
jgi:hypothetical protein